MESGISRRTFFLGIVSAVGTLITGCGGRGASSSSQPTQLTFRATHNDSVLANTRALYAVTTMRDDQEWEDTIMGHQVTRIKKGDETLLEGLSLVFEINDERVVSTTTSAGTTQVRIGDLITWKKL